MCFGKRARNVGRNFGMWTALAVGITAASMSASKKDEAHHAVSVKVASPRASLTLPLN